MIRLIFLMSGLAALLALASALPDGAKAQRAPSASTTRDALQSAQAAAEAAALRARKLDSRAEEATEAADKAAQQAAALAARIQQAEAEIATATAKLALIDARRRALADRLAEKQGPLVQLTAALQKLTLRPLALSALRPGSLRDTVYLRAVLDTTLPQVRARTADLRAQISEGAELARSARLALASLRESESELESRQQSLAALELRQRLASRSARGGAAREAERALALAEEARDLDALVEELDEAAELRAELAALPGPILRPGLPEASEVVIRARPSPTPLATAPPAGFQLPVAGRTVAGFGAMDEEGLRNRGVTLAPRPDALVVAPASGRVAFAGPYRGYGRIVIIEHGDGWTSLVTGLARTSVEVGENLVVGAPLGHASRSGPEVTLELHRQGEPVNPLNYL